MIEKKKCEWNAWILYAIIFIVFWLTFMYADITITYTHSLRVWDCIWQGDITKFYQVCYENQYLGCSANYYFPLYLIFAIWNLPIWLIAKIIEINIYAVPCLLWCKTMVVIFVIGCIVMLKRILKEMKCQEADYYVFIFATSLIFFIPTMAVAQYDVISVFFTLCGLYCFLKEQKFSLRVCLIFSLAISLKFFALFPFFILNLLYEKRILVLLKNMLLASLVSVLSIVLFSNSDAFQMTVTDVNGDFIGKLTQVTIDGGTGNISLFISCFLVVCILAYYLKFENRVQIIESCAWLMTFLFIAFFTFVPAFPYWIVIMSPYVAILLAMNMKNLRINLILEMTVNLSIILLHSVIYSWVYLTQGSFSMLILKNIPIPLNEDIRCVENIFEKFGLMKYMPAIYAVFAVCGIALCVLNVPWKKKEKYVLSTDECVIKNSMYIVRPLVIMGYCLITVAIVYLL